jgi:GT2 family glycosyltransferase
MEMAVSFEREVGLVSEIVVVDDASAVPVKIEGLRSPVRLLRNETARGFCGASDQSLREVRTPFALLVDADITFLPGDFSGAFNAFRSLPRLAWSNFQQVSVEGTRGGSSEEALPPAWIYGLGNQVTSRWWRWKYRSLHPVLLSDRQQRVPMAHSSSALVRMEAFREINGFDLRYWQCQSDNDLCLRLGKAGWLVAVDRIYSVQHDGAGGRTGGKSRVYDLYRGKLLLYETHRPLSRLYLRSMLFLRHLLEAVVAGVRGSGSDDHLSPAFRYHLAVSALKGYPALERATGNAAVRRA